MIKKTGKNRNKNEKLLNTIPGTLSKPKYDNATAAVIPEYFMRLPFIIDEIFHNNHLLSKIRQNVSFLS